MNSPPERLNSYHEVQDFLYGLKYHGAKYGIDRMRLLSVSLGHPERSFPVIHVAGTNGKGSTAAMLEAVFRAAGFKAGLYTSPHLVRLGERIQVNRRILSEPEITGLVNEIRGHAERIAPPGTDDHPSFFEFMTGAAFLHFAREKVDIGIIEVGLGGRLDATNVVEPELSVITSISLDHCDLLGSTEEQIAREKGGIIKPGRPAVLGHIGPSPEKVLRGIASGCGSPVHSVREAFGEDAEAYPWTSLEGRHQRWNAGTAALAARLLAARFRLTEAGIASALRAVDWPGRWQHLQLDGRELILEAAHNPEGAAMLDENLALLAASRGGRPSMVIGVLGEDRARALLAVAARHASEIHLAVPHQQRACSHDQLGGLVPPGFAGRVTRARLPELFPGPGRCNAGAPGGTVVVTGSIYLLGEVLERIEPRRGPGEGHLQDF